MDLIWWGMIVSILIAGLCKIYDVLKEKYQDYKIKTAESLSNQEEIDRLWFIVALLNQMLRLGFKIKCDNRTVKQFLPDLSNEDNITGHTRIKICRTDDDKMYGPFRFSTEVPPNIFLDRVKVYKHALDHDGFDLTNSTECVNELLRLIHFSKIRNVERRSSIEILIR